MLLRDHYKIMFVTAIQLLPQFHIASILILKYVIS